LSRHGVTHVFNNWADMPTVSEQRQMTGSRTNSHLQAINIQGEYKGNTRGLQGEQFPLVIPL
jgi:hypothetical protein